MSKSKVGVSPQQASEKWGRRLKQAIPDIVTGINQVTESPTEKAAGKQDKMLQNLTAAVTGGRWAAGLRKVSLQEWKTKTADKVQQRMSSGVDSGMAKRQAFDQYLNTTLNAVLPTIAAMPDMTLEDSVNRASALIRHMAANPYKK